MECRKAEEKRNGRRMCFADKAGWASKAESGNGQLISIGINHLFPLILCARIFRLLVKKISVFKTSLVIVIDDI